jgi:spermidine/putrescine transport system substrate-binding protein
MKRQIIIWLSMFVMLGLLLSACGGGQATQAPAEPAAATEAPSAAMVEPASQIVVYNWSEYIDPEIYTQFEQETGIKVVEDNFSSNEELYAKLKGGATGYAMIVPSDYYVAIMKKEGMLAELDQSKIPNLSNLATRFTQVPYDTGNQYCIPYQWGTTGIGYLDGQVDEPTSWSVFFDPDPNSPAYGRTTMLDDPRETFAAALIYLGYDINTTDEAQLQEAKDLLIKAKPALSGYDSDTYEDLVASEENLMAHGWNGDFLVAQEDNEDVAYTIPQEGGVVWVDNMCIPATATPEEKLAAEMLMDFILRPDMGAMLSNFTYYASPNKAAEDLLDADFLSDPAVYPPPEVMDKLQYITEVGDAQSLYERLWDEVKSAQ